MKKSKISVAMITYNEEGNIKDCLKSVRQLVDEIVIVDGSSRDKTREIAKEMGARVIKTTNKLFFDTNKNLAIEACQGDWVLLLDADERVTPELAKEIIATVKNWSEGLPVAYWMPRKNYFLGRYLQKGGQYPDAVIRLFKKGKAKMPAETAHQQLEVDGETGWLENDLLHWATPTFSRYWMRERRYSSLEALEMLKNKVSLNPVNWIKYFIFRPKRTFFLLYLRHKGFLDGWPGFVFAFFSGFHHAWAFTKYLKMKITKKRITMGEDW